MPQGYTSIRFERKAIRVKWDDKPKKYWFIVVDVLSYLFDNPHNFWKQIKSAIATNGEATSNYYISCTYDNETFDIADYQQIVNILKYVPGRVNKKERLVTWLIYPMTSAIQSRVYNELYKNNQTQTDWDNIIKEANNCGVRTETIKDYIDFLKNRKQYQAYINDINNQPTEKKEENTDKGKDKSDEKFPYGCLLLLAFAIISPFIYDGMQKYGSTHRDFAWILLLIFIIAVIAGLIIYNNQSEFIFIKTKKTKIKCQYCGKKIPVNADKCPFCHTNLIWQKIKDLTDLALSDRVLTDLERETIVNKAIKNGISRKEINNYLDNQLNQRLKTYTKVDLKDCPYCGGQIPLISDKCLYCGMPLEHIEESYDEPNPITGPEADIIISENNRIEEKRHNLKECPDCGAQFPLISNICPYCGHMLHERNENSLNIKQLLKNITKSIKRVNDAPSPTVFQIIDFWLYYIILALSVFTFIVAVVYDSEAGKIITIVGFSASITLTFLQRTTLKKDNSSVPIADEEYYEARYAYEMYARQIDTLYGDNPEAQQQLKIFAKAIKKLKKERYEKRSNVIMSLVFIAFVLFGVIIFFSAKDAQQKTPPPSKPTWVMPKNADEVLNLSKKIKPYPPDTGIDTGLHYSLLANKEAELTFVIDDRDNPTYHWKLNKVELISTDIYIRLPIYIELLDSNYQSIGMPSDVTHNHGVELTYGRGRYFADFWSQHSTKSEKVIKSIMQKAEYYTIYHYNPQK